MRLIYCTLIIFSLQLPSQLIAQSLISFSGGNISGAGMEISWSVGEVVIITTSGTENSFTQGYQQPVEILEVDDTTNTVGVTVDVITANDDGINDNFIIKDAENMPNNSLVIINRWREVVYWENGYKNDWKGLTLDGESLPQATYYYTYRPDRNKKKYIRGTIHVLRD